MTDPFDAYRLPASMTEGTTIELAGTPAKFVVKLPARSNEDFTMRLLVRLSSAGLRMSDGVDPIAIQIERKKLFLEECIVSAEGLPDGMGHEEFFKTYPLAAKDVFELAQRMAQEADADVDAALEKLSPTQSGQHSGQDEPSNTKTSSKRGSNRKQPDQKSAA